MSPLSRALTLLAPLCLALPLSARNGPVEAIPVEAEPIEPVPVDADPGEGDSSEDLPVSDNPVEEEPTAAETTPVRPHIILLVGGDHSPLALSPNLSALESWLQPGDEITPFTPQLDLWTQDGALCQSAWSTGLDEQACRRALLTGCHPVAGEKGSWSLPGELQAQGYGTACFGHWPLSESPRDFGFSTWEITSGSARLINPLYVGPGRRRVERGHEIDLTGRKMRQWIAAQPRSQNDPPFFVLAQFESPGLTPQAGPEEADLWGPELVMRPGGGWRFHPTLPMAPDLVAEAGAEREAPGAHADSLLEDYPRRGADGWFARSGDYLGEQLERLDDHQLDRWLASLERRNELRRQAAYAGFLDEPGNRLRWEQQRFLRQYLAAARRLDGEIGRLLDFLEEEGLAENTLVIYTSAAGSLLGQQGLIGRDARDADSLRVPLLWRWPGEIEAGTRLVTPVQTLDIAPTVLEFAGVSAAELGGDQRMQGTDLANRLRGLVEEREPHTLYFADKPEPEWEQALDTAGKLVDEGEALEQRRAFHLEP